MSETSTVGVISTTATDLTQLASAGKLEPVIGRDEEIARLINILTRRTKNNPALIGEAGVGKTAIVEGLAQRIVNGEVPERLKGKRILSLELANLIAGTSMRGQLEEKLSTLIREVTEAAGEILLFIDEMHLMSGAGAAGESALDVSNTLKPHLARGTVQCIGATTISEYTKYIERDPALARRFQKVEIKEPGVDDTVAILRGLRPGFEAHHGVKVRDSALVAAANLTARYIPDRRLPDKAIDLIDETASRRRTAIDSMPSELREVIEGTARLELEQASLRGDDDASARKRLKIVEKNLLEIRQQSEIMNTRWRQFLAAIQRRSILQQQLKALDGELERAKRRLDFHTVSHLEAQQAPLVKELQDNLDSSEDFQFSVPAEITTEDVAAQLSEWTGIPLSKVGETDANALINMEQSLGLHVIGQTVATRRVADAIRIARSGINDPARPLASFLFLGPTGVGKTEVAKVLADTVFGDSQALIRLDMSEYFDRYTVSRLIGAAPGYIGYDEGGQLTESVRRKPYSCILFDELEKAHRDVGNILLQILDEGHLTDARGRVVDFKNTIIIMTSNIGADFVLDKAAEQQSDDNRSIAPAEATCSRDDGKTSVSTSSLPQSGGVDALPERLRQLLLSRFRPELLNRIDDIVVFSPLTESDLRRIVELQISQLNERLQAQGAMVSLSAAAQAHLAKRAYSPAYGARPLRRLIRQLIQVPLSKLLLQCDSSSASHFHLDLNGDEMEFAHYTEQEAFPPDS
ncbi:MAG: AAA family ATPase [Candidatus Obscuribacterales bacterium]|nr:AAA family ATPase [Candidatus Obscuribacterales bacterium]